MILINKNPFVPFNVHHRVGNSFSVTCDRHLFSHFSPFLCICEYKWIELRNQTCQTGIAQLNVYQVFVVVVRFSSCRFCSNGPLDGTPLERTHRDLIFQTWYGCMSPFVAQVSFFRHLNVRQYKNSTHFFFSHYSRIKWNKWNNFRIKRTKQSDFYRKEVSILQRSRLSIIARFFPHYFQMQTKLI